MTPTHLSSHTNDGLLSTTVKYPKGTHLAASSVDRSLIKERAPKTDHPISQHHTTDVLRTLEIPRNEYHSTQLRPLQGCHSQGGATGHPARNLNIHYDVFKKAVNPHILCKIDAINPFKTAYKFSWEDDKSAPHSKVSTPTR